jgi:AcrR family transcriptional regulator
MARAPRRGKQGLEMPPGPMDPSSDTEPGPAPSMGAAAPGSDTPRSDADRVLDAALQLFGERGWRNTTLADVAAAAGVSLAELYALFPAKHRLLAAFSRRIDRTVLGETSPALADEPVRDRIFDLLMRRFDALAPYKPAVRVLFREAPRDPLSMLGSGPRLMRSMAWTLEAAGVGAQGFTGFVRVQMLAGLYMRTMRDWLSDESADLTATMAALDRNLGRVQRCLRA